MRLDKYFNVSSNHCVIAVVLDPRHKLEFYDDENQDAQENASQKEKIKKANPKRLCRVPQSKWLDAIRGIQNGIGLNSDAPTPASRGFKKKKLTPTYFATRRIFEYPSGGS
ncbi:hypothetical protein O5D80_005544 [Batrachochytrium dendrobatidis]|nr:hypothetical protein O5D80_005544 [Batrachochytrium dendrobatidis]